MGRGNQGANDDGLDAHPESQMRWPCHIFFIFQNPLKPLISPNCTFQTRNELSTKRIKIAFKTISLACPASLLFLGCSILSVRSRVLIFCPEIRVGEVAQWPRPITRVSFRVSFP